MAREGAARLQLPEALRGRGALGTVGPALEARSAAREGQQPQQRAVPVAVSAHPWLDPTVTDAPGSASET